MADYFGEFQAEVKVGSGFRHPSLNVGHRGKGVKRAVAFYGVEYFRVVFEELFLFRFAAKDSADPSGAIPHRAAEVVG